MYNTDPNTDTLGCILQILEGHVQRGTIFPASAPCRTGGVYIFSRWNDIPGINGDTIVKNLATPDFRNVKNLVTADNPQPINWEIDIWGYEFRTLQTGAATTTPTPQAELGNILDFATVPSSLLPVRVSWESNSSGTYRDIDVRKGARFNIRADVVQISALAPSSSRNTLNDLPYFLDPLNGQGQIPNLGGGLILSSLIGASVKPAEATYPAGLNTLTRTVLVESGDPDRTIEVPPGAIAVSAFQQPTTGAPAKTVSVMQAAGGTGVQVGQLEIPASFFLDRHPLPSQADFLQIDDQLGVDVVITFTFHLDV